MKANEAPEKIYIDDFGSELGCDWHTEHCYEKDIEYTRTDVIVEKAKQWFEKQSEWFEPDGKRHCDMSDFEDFKNYMKGE